jgi:hypothetical protein
MHAAVVDLGASIFAKGQAYVAASRVTTLEGLFLSDLAVSRVIGNGTQTPAHKEALQEMARLIEKKSPPP